MNRREANAAKQGQPPRSAGTCRRCGTCCRKGGPALHLADRELVETGKIPLKSLFTIRQGEPAYDNIRNVVMPASSDIIKIKGTGTKTATCFYLVRDEMACRIYADRPVECRALACWDTNAIEALYDKERLTRSHLLERLPGLIDFVSDHQEKVDYLRVARLAEQIREDADPQSAVDAMLSMIRYDHSIRQVTVERTRLDAELLDFLFGRPLTITISKFYLKLADVGSVITIQPTM